MLRERYFEIVEEGEVCLKREIYKEGGKVVSERKGNGKRERERERDASKTGI